MLLKDGLSYLTDNQMQLTVAKVLHNYLCNETLIIFHAKSQDTKSSNQERQNPSVHNQSPWLSI
jgi:hypothetical protein